MCNFTAFKLRMAAVQSHAVRAAKLQARHKYDEAIYHFRETHPFGGYGIDSLISGKITPAWMMAGLDIGCGMDPIVGMERLAVPLVEIGQTLRMKNTYTEDSSAESRILYNGHRMLSRQRVLASN